MAKKHGRRRFERRFGQRRYRTLFIIGSEGAVTEPEYFSLFNSTDSTVRVEPLAHKTGSSPEKVLRRMESRLDKGPFGKNDQAWLVVDKDQWNDDQLNKLHKWTKKKNRGLAVSNPAFEFWLLLHFEEGKKIDSAQACLHALREHLPGYDKTISRQHFKPEKITQAVERARNRDHPPCTDWPRSPGCTTVYRLVEEILRAQKG